jgi:DNA-binding NarL/FixJ family response regulator
MIRVLLVDDHPLARAGLEQLLSSFTDIEVVGAARDGEEAVRLVTERAPDVVLMDLEMPNMDGITATSELRRALPETVVIILTSFLDRTRILRALDAGAAGYLLKDAEPEELERAIQAAARGEAPLDPRAARELIDERGSGPGAGRLSARETEVLALVARGLPNKLIARQLGISERTVKGHLTRVFEHIGVSDRTQAALWAGRHGIT